MIRFSPLVLLIAFSMTTKAAESEQNTDNLADGQFPVQGTVSVCLDGKDTLGNPCTAIGDSTVDLPDQSNKIDETANSAQDIADQVNELSTE